MKTAIANKVWLSGDVDSEEICSRLLYHSILGAFVRASPYSFYNLFAMTKDEVANYVAEMLRFDNKIPALALEFGPLNSCATRWRVLDVWKLALERAGHDPLSVIGDDVWESNAHLYDEAAGFVSTPTGTAVSMSVGPRSGKVCLAVEELRYKHEKGNLQRVGELEDLTRDWTLLDHTGSHCEIYQLPARGIELDEYQPGYVSTARRRAPEAESTFSATEDGGIEMFIECCQIYEPWTVLSAEIKKEKEAFEKKSAEAKGMGQRSESGILSKVVSVGGSVLAAFV